MWTPWSVPVTLRSNAPGTYVTRAGLDELWQHSTYPQLREARVVFACIRNDKAWTLHAGAGPCEHRIVATSPKPRVTGKLDAGLREHPAWL